MRRLGWLMGLVWLAGCHSFEGRPAASPPPSAHELWRQGQQAMQRGAHQQAVALYEASLRSDRALTHNHLSLAAAFLAQGEQEAACRQLGHFLDAHPWHCRSRLYLAELLLRIDEPAAARDHFEETIAHTQEQETGNLDQLIHCHNRLFEISQVGDDAYGAHLHRGIALYLLAGGRAQLAESAAVPTAETLLCKAAAELTEAGALGPDQARPAWYLYRAWHDLAQQHQAQRWLRQAEQAAPFSHLTPAEQRSLELACRQRSAPPRP